MLTGHDAYENVLERHIGRPSVLNTYFNESNGVDRHNQARQSLLALEECWVTVDGYFRQWTTFFGISVIDAWYLKQKRNQKMFNDDEKTRISEFANELAWSLLQKGKSFAPTPSCIIANNNSADDSISKLTNATESSEGSHTHLFLTRTRKDDESQYYVQLR